MVHQHGHFEHLLHSVETVDVATVLTIIWFSFVMSWHCAAMCGPLVCARFARAEAKSSEVLLDVLAYNLGRIISYTLMGALIGAIVSGIADSLREVLPWAGIVLSIMFAVLLAWQGFFLVFDREVVWAPRVVTNFAARLSGRVGRGLTGRSQKFALGVVTVFLPCMTLSSALAAAAMTGETSTGAFIMFGFVLGTLPVMISVTALSANLTASVSAKVSLTSIRRLAGALLLAASAMTLLRIFH